MTLGMIGAGEKPFSNAVSSRNKYFPRHKQLQVGSKIQPKRLAARIESPTSATLFPPSLDTNDGAENHVSPDKHVSKPPMCPSRTHRRHTSEGEFLLSKTSKRPHRRLASSLPTTALKTTDDKLDGLDELLQQLSPSTKRSISKHTRRLSENCVPAKLDGTRWHHRVCSSPSAFLVGSHEEDMNALDSILQERIEKYGESHPKVSLSFNNIGNFYFKRGNFSQALASYKEALRSYQVCFGPEHPFVAHTMTNIATAHWRLGDYDSALKPMEQCCRILRKTVGKDHLATGNAMHSLGQVLCLRGDNNEAMLALKQALTIRRENLGELNIDVARTLSLMGSVQLQRGNLDDSMKLHQEAVQMKRALLEKCHPSVIISMLDVAHVHKKRGNIADSIQMYRETLRLQKELCCMTNLPEQYKDVGGTLHAIGNAHARIGELEEAEKAFNEAYLVYKNVGVDKDDRSIIALQRSIAEINNSIPEENDEDEE